jgi:uncharacterized protein
MQIGAKCDFDPANSAAGLAKHGIDFERAQDLWTNERTVLVRTAFPHEERWLAIGIVEDRYWTMVYTKRKARVRIISVRRSTDVEIRRHQDTRD